MTKEEIIDLLCELEYYFQDREDCEVIGGTHVPNKEMNLRMQIIELKEQLIKTGPLTPG